MKISLGMPIPDLGSLPGSRPGGGGNTLFGFYTSSAAQPGGTDACTQATGTTRYKSTSSSTPVAVGNVIFREQAGESYPSVGHYRDPLAGFYKVGDDGLVESIGACLTIESFDSTTEAQSSAESICEASVEGKMYKLGSSDLETNDIVYKDSNGSELADEGFYKTEISGVPHYYRINGSGEVIDVVGC